MRYRLRDLFCEHLWESWPVWLLVVLCFTVGIATGALSVRLLAEGQVRELNELIFGFVGCLTGNAPINQGLIFQKSLVNNVRFLLLLWLCGNVFFGFLPALALLFYRGFTVGFAVGFLAEQNALRGTLFAVAAILPQNLIYIPGAVASGACAVMMSFLHLRQRFSRKSIPRSSYLAQFTLMMLALALVLALGSMVEAVITPVFMRAVVSLL